MTFIGVQLTRGLTSYGWSHKLRVVSQVTGGLTSYGWSHKLWVVSQVMGGLTSYGWSHKLWVVSQVMGGLTSSHRKNLWRLVLDLVTIHYPNTWCGTSDNALLRKMSRGM